MTSFPAVENCWSIHRPESSVLLAQTISLATGHCDHFGQYSGRGYNCKDHCESLTLYKSLPYRGPGKFQDSLFREISAFSDNYERVNHIVTTRDRNCSIQSEIRRFGGSIEEAQEDYVNAFPFFEKPTSDDDCFIWSDESMLVPESPYYPRLYRLFGIDSDFTPELHDGNAPYMAPAAAGASNPTRSRLSKVVRNAMTRIGSRRGR